MDKTQIKILLIEDNPVDVILLREALGQDAVNTFELSVVERLDAALAALQAGPFDVILLDLGLPDSQGLDTFTHIHQADSNIPKIILSGLSDDALALHAVHAGAQDYILKGTAGFASAARAIRYAIERQKLHAALRASEERFRAMIENGLDDISLLDAHGNLLWESPSVIRNLGYAEHEFLERNMFELIHPDDQVWARTLFAKLLNEPGTSQRGVFRLQHANGSWRWVEAVVTNLLENPSVQAIVANYRDITEHKQAEEMLRASQEQFRIAQDMSPDGFTILQPVRDAHERVIDFTWVYENAAVARLNGTDTEAVVGKRLLELFPGHRDTPILRTYQQVAESGEVCIFEADYSGESMPKPTSFRIVVVPMAGNIAILAQDITESKVAEEKLQSAGKFLRASQNALSAHISILDDDGTIVQVNSAWREFADQNGLVSPNYGIGLNYLEICDSAAGADAEEAPLVANAIREIVAGKMEQAQIEYPCHSPTEQRWFLLQITSFKDGEHKFVVLAQENISERKLAENRIHESQARLAEAQTMAKVGSWETDLRTLQVVWSHETYRIFEVDVNTFGKSHPAFLDFVHPEDRKKVDDAFAGSLEKDSYTTIEHRIVTARGNVKFVEERWRVESDTQGRPVRAVGTCQDITERKQAEAQLRKLSLAVEQSASTIVITDKAGNIEYANPKFTETTGYALEEVYGQNPRILKSGHTSQADYERMWMAITTGQEWRGEFSNRKKNGELYWESATISPIFNERSEITNFIAVKEDITERKQTENKLLEANERFQQLADNIQEVFWITDAVTGEYLYISPAGEKIWGHSIEDLLQIPDIFINSILPEDRPMVLLTIEQQRTGQKTEMEYRLVHPDGSVHWIWDRAFPIFDEAGSVMRVAGIAMDVTERKQITDDLRARDVLLREAQRIARLGHYQFDILTGFWESSDVLNAVFGIDNDYRKDMNGWAGLILPAQRDEMLTYFTNDVVAERKPFDREYQIMRNDNGETRWVHGLGQLEFDSAGNPVRMLGTIQDITERRLIEAETRRHLVELEALYENGLAVGQLLTPSEIGDRIISTFEHYLAWHHVTVRLRKEKSDELELVAFNLPDFEEDEKPGAVQRFKDMVNKVGQGLSGWVVQTGIPIRTGNVHDYRQYVEYQTGIQSGLYMPLKIGESVIGSISVESKLADAFSAQDERLLATLANQAAVAFENARLFQSAHQELSERIHVEQMLELERNSLAQRVEERTFDLSRANANLARALRVKDEFLANMSHELRTPLNAILGLSESLAEQTAGPLNEKQLRYITTVSESGHHLLSLINDILDLAKIEAGQITLDVNKVDINSVCQSSLRMVKQLAQKKKQEVVVEIDGKVSLMWADERRLKQMLVNLLGNAVKFTPEGNKLGLEVYGDQDANKVTFTVWDTGIGIKEADLPRLFQPFVQLDAGLAREASGTGLGLALVSQMARLHGGSVSVTSQPGKGSRFTIMLPWEPALAVDTVERLKITGKFRPIKLTQGHKPTILLIEDTQEVIMMLSDYLELNGFKVITAHDGVEGVTQAQLTHPDLILMDIQMPRMDGFEATKKLRSEPEFKHTPIIALTALAMPNDRELCLAAGMDEYITKPVHLRGLIKVIETFLSGEKETKPQ